MTMPHALPLHANGVSLCLEELLAYEQQFVHFTPARQIWSQRVGQHQSRRLGRGMDFSEVRQYQAGMTFVRLIGESPHEQVNPILSCSVKSAKERWCSISISVPRCSLDPVYC